jgi:hypothetical protein
VSAWSARGWGAELRMQYGHLYHGMSGQCTHKNSVARWNTTANSSASPAPDACVCAARTGSLHAINCCAAHMRRPTDGTTDGQQVDGQRVQCKHRYRILRYNSTAKSLAPYACCLCRVCVGNLQGGEMLQSAA